jgi:hypothetical protein
MMKMSDIEDMVKMLADAPEEQRKKMITERLKMIAGQPEDQRIKSVAGIVLAVSKLKKKRMAGFINTRTLAMLELPPEEGKVLMVARVKAGKTLPEDVNMKDMKLIHQATLDWPEQKREMFNKKLQTVFDELGMSVPAM